MGQTIKAREAPMPRHIAVTKDRGGRTILVVDELPRHTFVGPKSDLAVGVALSELGLRPEHPLTVQTPRGEDFAGTVNQFTYGAKDLTKTQRLTVVKGATYVS